MSRLIGLHKLSVLGIYSYLLKYLSPRQRDVTHFLACTAQAAHDLVPPDVLEPIVKKIADEFVSEGVASEVATAGYARRANPSWVVYLFPTDSFYLCRRLNSIREICARAPLAMNATLLQDLVEYKGSKDKGVMMAARGLIGLYREIAPEMLKKKDRGKSASMGMKDRETLRFGIEKSGEIEGLELLEEWKEEQRRLKRAERGLDSDVEGEETEEVEEDWGAWEAGSDDSDDDETGWINVDSDHEIEISDSEDESEKKPRKKSKKAEEEEEEEATKDSETPNGQPIDEKIQEIEKKLSTLATTRILTPADFAKLAELRTQAGLDKLLGNGKKADKHHTNRTPITNEDAVDVLAIQGPAKRGKADKEARLAVAAEGREGRDKFGSKKGKHAEKSHSTTNKEKERKKNFLMTVRKAKGKQKRSLVEKRRVLKAHVEKQKKAARKH